MIYQSCPRQGRAVLHEHGNPTKAAELACMRETVRDMLERDPPPLLAPHRPDKVDMSTLSPETQGGTSREYTVRRLKRDRPDLAEMVIGGGDLAPPIYRTRTAKMVYLG